MTRIVINMTKYHESNLIHPISVLVSLVQSVLGRFQQQHPSDEVAALTIPCVWGK